MSKPFRKPSLIVRRSTLVGALERTLTEYYRKPVAVSTLKRVVSDYCSSYVLEELDLRLSNGRTLSLIFKDLSLNALISTARKVKPAFLYQPLREIDCYRTLLARHELGTARCYGSVIDAPRHRYWLFIERVPPTLLWQIGDFTVWKDVARWLVRMHSCLSRDHAGRGPAPDVPLLVYDAKFYRRWIQRARKFVRAGDSSRTRKAAKSIDWLATRHELLIDRLSALPINVVHGEFYASNIMVDSAPGKLRVCPVDWEMAALAPGQMDVATLASGNWTQQEKDSMALAYYSALPAAAMARWDKRDFLTGFKCCRLHLAVRLLGWSPGWTPPSEHAQNWLAEAVQLAEELKL